MEEAARRKLQRAKLIEGVHDVSFGRSCYDGSAPEPELGKSDTFCTIDKNKRKWMKEKWRFMEEIFIERK